MLSEAELGPRLQMEAITLIRIDSRRDKEMFLSAVLLCAGSLVSQTSVCLRVPCPLGSLLNM